MNKIKFNTLILTIIFLFEFSNINAQHSMVSTGKNIVNDNGSVSYSIGQVIYQSDSGKNGFVVQGVQQPYEISIVGLDNYPDILIVTTAYPNPTNNLLFLKIANQEPFLYTLTIFDLNGKKLESLCIEKTETTIDMTPYANGVYFFKISNHSNIIKSFKIVKK